LASADGRFFCLLAPGLKPCGLCPTVETVGCVSPFLVFKNCFSQFSPTTLMIACCWAATPWLRLNTCKGENIIIVLPTTIFVINNTINEINAINFVINTILFEINNNIFVINNIIFAINNIVNVKNSSIIVINNSIHSFCSPSKQ